MWPMDLLFILLFITDYGNEEIKTACEHFYKILSKLHGEFSIADTLAEWQLMKRVIFKR